RSRTGILVSVLDIGPMARSGRVSEKIGSLLIRFRFKPLITIDQEGKGTIKGLAFTERRNRKILLKSLRRRRLETYVIVHSGAEERAEELKKDMIRMTGRPPLYMTAISSVVTLFAGSGSVAVAYTDRPY
ncbi:MAG: DegV family protein, partial [Saccharofermentanales bacterium]